MAEISSENDPKTYAIIGAAMSVHRELGFGFLEAVYHEALAIELEAQAIPFRREAELPVIYRGRKLAVIYRADIVCYETIVVELKAIAKLGGTEEGQLLNYLKASNQRIGLLLNFGRASLEWRRIINSPAPVLHESKSP